MNYPLLFVALSVVPVSAAYVVEFDSPGDLAANFNTAQPGGISQSATGGINNGGALDLSGLSAANQQVLTFNQSFSPTLASWSMSLYFKGDAQNFWQVGVTTADAPGVDEGYLNNGSYLPVIFMQSGNLGGGAFGLAGYSPSGTFVNSDPTVVAGGLPTTDEWYRYTMSVNYLGLSQYQVQGTLTAADASGTLGATLATNSYTFTNPELAANPTAHLYIYMYDGSVIDRFETTVVPEVGSTMILGASLAGMAFFRRRSR